MKVSGNSGGVGATPGWRGAASPPERPARRHHPSPAVQGDALSVSSSAQFMAAARAELAQIPDIRTDKVQAIKAKIGFRRLQPRRRGGGRRAGAGAHAPRHGMA